MAIDFPDTRIDNPETGLPWVNGDTFTDIPTGLTYYWFDPVWKRELSVTEATDEKYVERAGDNMTGNLTLGDGTDDKITLDATDGNATFAGNVGVGNSSPRGPIHIGADLASGATDAAALNLKQTSTTASTGIYLERSGERRGYSIYVGGGQDSLTFQRNNAGTKSDVMVITRNGNVGINTTSPSAELALGPTYDTTPSDVTKIRLYDIGSGIIYGLGVSDSQFNYRTGTANDAHVWYAGTTERMRIDSFGRLLMGTSSARSNFYKVSLDAGLQIENTGSAQRGLAVVTNSSTLDPGTIAIAKSNSNTIGSNVLVDNDQWIGNISFQGNDGNDFVSLAHIDAYVDGTPGANDMPGRLVFSTTADGASNPTERMRITSNGTIQLRNSPGIDFSQIKTNAAGVTSETLDSYEEGNWTPTLDAGGIVNNIYSATYVKIGRLVTANMYISVENIPNNSSIFKIGSLPFSGGIDNNYGGGNITYSAAFDTSGIEPVVQQQGSFIYFHRVDGYQPALSNSTFTGLVQILLQVTYMTV